MDNDWYAWDGGREHGPFILEEIRRRVAAGQLPPHTQVKRGPSGAWIPLPTPVAASAPPEPGALVGRAVITGALTGIGFVIISGILFLIRYALQRFQGLLLVGPETKWHLGLAIAVAVTIRLTVSGPRRDPIALALAATATILLGDHVAIALCLAVIVQLKLVQGVLFALPAGLFCWAFSTSGFNTDEPFAMLLPVFPIAVWFGLALGAGAIARVFTPKPVTES